MLNQKIILLVFLIIFIILPSSAGTIEGLPLHVQKIADNVIRMWVGDYMSSTAISAIATQKGIVVIDTTDVGTIDQGFRKIIAKEFQRNDFKYLINTHGHADHTNGNDVYNDCEIIAQENAIELITTNFSNFTEMQKFFDGFKLRLNEELNSDKLTDNKKALINEQIKFYSIAQESMKAYSKPTFPTKTFKGKLTLDCGDVTLELFQAGGTHTTSDIFILYKEKGILFTGDIMADKWLTDIPGCLANFKIQAGTPQDYVTLQQNWKELLDKKDQIKFYIPGHWNAELSQNGFQNRYNYFITLIDAVKTMSQKSQELPQFVASYTLKNIYPQLVDSPGFSQSNHIGSIYHLYSIYSGKISASLEIQKILQKNLFIAQFPILKEDILKARDKYFILEEDINRVGYFLLQQIKEPKGAIALFEFNVELFPNSWNAYDSLAEAYYTNGEKTKALKLFKKAVEMNPKNENGKNFIIRIEKEL